MKNNFKVTVLAAIFSLGLGLTGLNANQNLPFANPDQAISMDFQNASLNDILKIFSIQSGLNFIASEAVKDRTMTLYFDKVPIQEAMNKLFKANNLSYEMDPDSNVFIVKDMGQPQVEVETRVFYLKYASVSSSHIMEEVQNNIGNTTNGTTAAGSTATTTTSSTTSSTSNSTSGTNAGTGGDRYGVATDIGITTAIRKLLSKNGSVIEDYRTNSLIVQDIPTRMPMIARTIAALDVSTPMVRIEAEMLDVNKGLVDKLGFKFGQSPLTLSFNTGPTLTGLALSNFPLFNALSDIGGATKSMTSGNMTINPGSAASPAYTVILDFLKTQSDTKFLARPNILTLSNQTAEVKIEQDNVPTSLTTSQIASGANPIAAQSLNTATIAVSLRVTPQINLDTNEVTMFIMPIVQDTSSAGFAINGVTVQTPETRSSKSIIRVKDGETVVLGGLIRNKKSETITKLPVFGDIPVIGAMFRNRTKDQDTERELLVFITPHIIRDKTMKLAKTANASPQKISEREQDAFLVPERQASVNSALNKYENKY